MLQGGTIFPNYIDNERRAFYTRVVIPSYGNDSYIIIHQIFVSNCYIGFSSSIQSRYKNIGKSSRTRKVGRFFIILNRLWKFKKKPDHTRQLAAKYPPKKTETIKHDDFFPLALRLFRFVFVYHYIVFCQYPERIVLCNKKYVILMRTNNIEFLNKYLILPTYLQISIQMRRVGNYFVKYVFTNTRSETFPSFEYRINIQPSVCNTMRNCGWTDIFII